jgi:hypothetical protein
MNIGLIVTRDYSKQIPQQIVHFVHQDLLIIPLDDEIVSDIEYIIGEFKNNGNIDLRSYNCLLVDFIKNLELSDFVVSSESEWAGLPDYFYQFNVENNLIVPDDLDFRDRATLIIWHWSKRIFTFGTLFFQLRTC